MLKFGDKFENYLYRYDCRYLGGGFVCYLFLEWEEC